MLSEFKPDLTLKKMCSCVGCIFGKLKSENSRVSKHQDVRLLHKPFDVSVDCEYVGEPSSVFYESLRSQRAFIASKLGLLEGIVPTIGRGLNDFGEEVMVMTCSPTIPHAEVRQRRKKDLKSSDMPSYYITSDVKSTYWSFITEPMPNDIDATRSFVNSSTVCKSGNMTVNDLFYDTPYDLTVIPDGKFQDVYRAFTMHNALFVNDLVAMLTFVEGSYNEPTSSSRRCDSKQKNQDLSKNGVFVTLKLIPIDFMLTEIMGDRDVSMTDDASLLRYYGKNSCIRKTRSFGFRANVGESDTISGVSVPMRFTVFDGDIASSVDSKKMYDDCVSLNTKILESGGKIDSGDILSAKRRISEAYDWGSAYTYSEKNHGSDDACVCYSQCDILAGVKSSDPHDVPLGCDNFNRYNVVFVENDANETHSCRSLWSKYTKSLHDHISVEDIDANDSGYNKGRWFVSKCKVSGKEHPIKKWTKKIECLEKQKTETDSPAKAAASSDKVNVQDVKRTIKPATIIHREDYIASQDADCSENTVESSKTSHTTTYNQALGCVKMVISDAAYENAIKEFLKLKKAINGAMQHEGGDGGVKSIDRHVTYVALPKESWIIVNPDIPCCTISELNKDYYGNRSKQSQHSTKPTEVVDATPERHLDDDGDNVIVDEDMIDFSEAPRVHSKKVVGSKSKPTIDYNNPRSRPDSSSNIRKKTPKVGGVSEKTRTSATKKQIAKKETMTPKTRQLLKSAQKPREPERPRDNRNKRKRDANEDGVFHVKYYF